MFYLVLISTIFTLLYFFVKKKYNYWQNLGILGPKPYIIVGNYGDNFLLRRSMGQISTDIYNDYKSLPFVGIYKATVPALLVRDPNFIRDITVKEFQHFRDNDVEVDPTVDPITGRNPFVLKGDHWKSVRSLLTPCFSSGKMKSLMPLMLEVGNNMATYIESEINQAPLAGLEMKELCGKYMTDSVASCVFGLEGKSFVDPNAELRAIAKNMITPDSASFLFVLAFMIPAIPKFFRLSLIPKEITKRTFAIVEETLKYRRENNVVRKDFIHFMNELKETAKDDHFTDADVTAHCSEFLMDGIETTSVVMSFTLFELAANLDVQQKLRNEILEAIKANDGKIEYEMIQDLPYLDAVISENLRIHPPGMQLGKVCTKDYTYICRGEQGLKEQSVTVEKGTQVIIPSYALQMDPKYFPDPELFIPDRFLKENKSKVRPYTYMPFGEGPRACLGQRFALLQVKLGLIFIMKNFELRLNGKTEIPLKYDPSYFLLHVKNGLWVNLIKLKQ